MPKLANGRVFVGVDPGKAGGIAVIRGGTLVTILYKMPNSETDIWNCINSVSRTVHLTGCMIEKVHSMPKQGVASSFTFGMGYGGLRMALIAAAIPFEDVTPQCWQKHFGISRHKDEPQPMYKKRLRALAQRFFPGVDVRLETADALLIALYCKRKYEGVK